MRACFYQKTGGPEVLEIGGQPEPVLKPSEIKIKVHAAGINPIDTYWLTGVRQAPTPLPRIPCVDAAGVIEKTGERVWVCGGSGAAAEWMSAPAHLVHPIPETLNFEQAAAIPTVFKTAYGALVYRGELKSGQSVLIQGGAGAVGQAAIQIAKILGARVITTVSSDEKAAVVKSLKPDLILNYKTQNVAEEIKKTFGGVDVILEVSTSENIEMDLAVLNIGGRMINVGSPKNFKPEIPLVGLNAKNAGLLGFMVFSMPAEWHGQAAEFINAGFQKKSLQLPAIQTFAFEKIREAFALQLAKTWTGKAVVKIG